MFWCRQLRTKCH